METNSERVPIGRFLELSMTYPVFDVRSPSEYENGHIPGAISLPLFSDEERAVIGTIYKKQGHDKAVLQGLDCVGPKMRHLAETIRRAAGSEKTALIHCWRGGMRSESVAWLAGFCGVRTIVLDKGYKAYRAWCIEQFSRDRTIVILGGRTGSGKTELLKVLRDKGEQVIDLEGLAHHKGSSFGALGEEPQPHQEMFENLLATELSHTDPSHRLWLEDESVQIGRCIIPDAFWPKMRASKVIDVEVSFNRRADYLFAGYGSFDPALLAQCAKKIEKRFGPNRTKDCLDAIERGDIRAAIAISLDYYDRTYDYGLEKRSAENIRPCPIRDDESFQDAADELIAAADSFIL